MLRRAARLPRRARRPINALVNPVIEWSGKEKEIAEEGCLSLPGVMVEVERPVHVRVRAQDEHGEDARRRGIGLEARVIQHEMDHLDGVLILDRTARDQRKEAMRALRERLEADDDARGLVRTVYLGTSRLRGRASSSASPETEHRPQLVVTRPTARRAAGRKLQSPAVADAARELGHRARPARVGQRRRGPRADRRRRARRADRLRVRRADQGAAADATSRCSTCTRRCCRAGAARRRWSARSWPATRETGVAIMRLTAGLDEGPVALMEAEPIAARRRLRHARRRAWRSRRAAADPRARRAPAVRRAAGRGRHLRREDHRRGPHAGPGRARRRSNARIVRALHPHIGARARPRGRQLPRRAPGPRGGRRRARAARGAAARRPADALRRLRARARRAVQASLTAWYRLP